ncbi:alpha/beta fold hydrolase [Microbacterium sp. P06]|uniref:alpha/beta fold hydrolase n=1 Tax=unclassified Microbacterium TaxID=2609290 RepID=UPI003746B0AA
MTRPPESPSSHERRIDLAGSVFRVVTTDSTAAEPGPPFVLVHGIGMSHRYFTKLHALLSVESDVHSIDLPGFGGLPKPGRDLDVEAMAGLLGEVLDQIGTGPVVLVGHSMGSQWVVELGAQRPDLVRAVVAIGPVTDDRHTSVFAQATALTLDSLGEPPLINAIVFVDYLRCGVPWYLAQVRHMLTYPIEERVADLASPFLVIRGGTDPIAGTDWCRRLRDRAADGTFVTVPGHNHVVQQSAPRSTASAIDAFLAARIEGGA